MSLVVVLMVVVFDDADVLVETEDGTSQEERLGHVVEQPCGHVFNLDDLVGHESDTAHDEQHRTGVLRDFEAFLFHGPHSSFTFLLFYFFTFLPLHHDVPCRASQQEGDDVTNHLKNRFPFLVHNFFVFLMVNKSC